VISIGSNEDHSRWLSLVGVVHAIERVTVTLIDNFDKISILMIRLSKTIAYKKEMKKIQLKKRHKERTPTINQTLLVKQKKQR
jgi:hypothetical protein